PGYGRPSPSLGPPLLSPSWSPPLEPGMKLVGIGVGGGVGRFFGRGAGGMVGGGVATCVGAGVGAGVGVGKFSISDVVATNHLPRMPSPLVSPAALSPIKVYRGQSLSVTCRPPSGRGTVVS